MAPKMRSALVALALLSSTPGQLQSVSAFSASPTDAVRSTISGGGRGSDGIVLRSSAADTAVEGASTIVEEGSSSQQESPSPTTKTSDNDDANQQSNDDAKFDLEAVLDAALRPNADASAETLSIVERISTLRRSGDQAGAEACLDEILSLVDARPLWTKGPLGGMSVRLSRRARRASVSRVLDLSTPEVEYNENSGGGDAEEDAGRRRRRALGVLLRALVDESKIEEGDESSSFVPSRPAIRTIEKAAISNKKSRGKATFFSATDRLPAGLETPTYELISRRTREGYEIRKYEPYSVCTVNMDRKRPVEKEKTDATVSQPQLTGASSFGALAGYLFGKNSEDSAMKMTTPVLTTTAPAAGGGENKGESGSSDDDSEGREMSFILPSEYWNESGTSKAPQPLDLSGVTLRRDAGGMRAVSAFGGYASKKIVDDMKVQILESLEKDEEYEIDLEPCFDAKEEGAGESSAMEAVMVAQYNDPFTPPWKRRNEVAVAIKLRQK